jgi:tripartite-type tricarboxylate transporter receptor subunit TctC
LNISHHKAMKTIAAFLGGTALMMGSVGAMAAECPAGFPDKPISFLVGYGPGGGTDTVARRIAASFEETQGWTVVVENKPGANGGVMSAGLQRSTPDGYTIGVTASTTMTVNPNRDKDTPYTHADFAYLGSGMLLNFGLAAVADSPYKNLEEFVEYARKNGRATISVAGFTFEILVKQIAQHYGVDLVPVPAKGSANALKDALGGHVDATMQGAVHVSQIRAGKMIQLATLTGQRAKYAPDAKTLLESGVGLSAEGHIIFALPKDVPADIQKCLSGALAEATDSAGYQEFMDKLEAASANMGPDGTATHLKDQSAFYAKAIPEMQK